MNESIFKSYDIRGTYPDQLDDTTAELVGRAYAQATQAHKIAVGRDTRLSSPQLHAALIRGIISTGCAVVDLGLVPSEVMYFATAHYGCDAGFMVTASHNPKEYNGIRAVDRNLSIQPGKILRTYLDTIRDQAGISTGTITAQSAIPDYIEHVLTFIDVGTIKPLRVVVDAGNGMSATTIPKLFARLPCALIPIAFELDGNFPSRPPNPLLPESRVAIQKRVVEEKADCGFLFDCDADRVLMVTEQGEVLRGDTMLLVIARRLLQREPGAGVAFNVVCSKAVPELVAKWGGRPIRTPVGFVNVSGGMRKHNGIVGGETSAHYCFRDNKFCDSGLIALVTILELLSESDQPASQIANDCNPYHRQEVYFTLDDIPGTIARLRTRYSDGRLDELDGLTVTYPDWWMNVRPSNTEPLLRLTIEADDTATLKAKLAEITAEIGVQPQTV
jgi:phosphomannomutase